jgi:hypothetical protein
MGTDKSAAAGADALLIFCSSSWFGSCFPADKTLSQYSLMLVVGGALFACSPASKCAMRLQTSS